MLYWGIPFFSTYSIEEALAKLKRNQERRLARKNAKEAGLYPPPKRTSTISVELAMPSSGPTTNAVVRVILFVLFRRFGLLIGDDDEKFMFVSLVCFKA